MDWSKLGYFESERLCWKNRIRDRNFAKEIADFKTIDYIHVGPHRTASTLLQTFVFPLLEDKRTIFSNEAICGRLLDNGVGNVSKIHSLSPKSKIIVVLRRQRDLIPSAYWLYVKAGGVWLYKQFVRAILDIKKYDFYILLNEYFKFFGKNNCLTLVYEDLLFAPERFYSSLFDFLGVDFNEYKEVIFNLPKGLNKSPSRLCMKAICLLNRVLFLFFKKAGWTGRDMQGILPDTIDERLRKKLVVYFRIIDKILNRNFAIKGFIEKINKQGDIEALIYEYYKVSNVKVASLIGRDLSIYGYY